MYDCMYMRMVAIMRVCVCVCVCVFVCLLAAVELCTSIYVVGVARCFQPVAFKTFEFAGVSRPGAA